MTDDPLLQLIARLPQAESDTARAERVRVRCRTALVRERQRAEARATSASGLWPAVAILGCAYATEAIRQALRLYGLL